MKLIKTWIKNLPWSMTLLFCLSLGLAPFTPPHVWEKLVMLSQGNLVKLVDIGDLIFHGSPWILLFIKSYLKRNTRKDVRDEGT